MKFKKSVMDFDFTDEQRLLRDSVERLMADRYDFEARRRHAAEPDGWSRALWSQYAELGLLGLPFAEAEGGFGGGPVETMIVMQAFGASLVLEPYLRDRGAGRRAAAPCGGASGSCCRRSRRASCCSRSRNRSGSRAGTSTTSRPRRGATAAAGASRARRASCCTATCADKLLVTARTGGGRRDRDGIGLFLVDAGAEGVSRRALSDAGRVPRR